ncbi:uncharacterized protein LOC142317681 [Lycorma delicatula]|uniref:uncharacterized protein LOC142317681 n=1 Tax=Lycorma delicatula TaxID=130591 RepID=UPI003F516804
MWRKFTEQGNYRWTRILDELINNYNNRVHRSTGLKPQDVSYKNERKLLINLSKTAKKRRRCTVASKFNVGDKVRISKYKKTFAKGYLPNWTNEVFTICKVKMTQPITFVLKDGKGEIVKGSFYTEELSKIKYGNVYLVEKVLKKRGNKLLVRWLGFDKKEDSWITKEDLIK